MLSPARQQIDLEKVKSEGKGNGIVPIDRACHKDQACK